MNDSIAETWRETAAQARRLVDAGRQPYGPIEQLSALYRQISDDERAIADGLIAHDLDSEDSGVRYDAMWLIREFGIESAIPALQKLAMSLASSNEVGAPFELDKVERLIRELTGPEPAR